MRLAPSLPSARRSRKAAVATVGMDSGSGSGSGSRLPQDLALWLRELRLCVHAECADDDNRPPTPDDEVFDPVGILDDGATTPVPPLRKKKLTRLRSSDEHSPASSASVSYYEDADSCCRGSSCSADSAGVEVSTLLNVVLAKARPYSSVMSVDADAEGVDRAPRKGSSSSDVAAWKNDLRAALLAQEDDNEWFSSHDSEGRVYFYEADSTESSWRLPDLPKIVCEAPVLQVSEPNEIFKEKEKKLSLTVSSDDSQIRHQSEDRPTFRITKARSMVFSDAKHKEGLNKSSSFPRNRTDVLEPSLEIIKEGVLNRTKITENNKKVRKNWSTAYVVLTQTQLLFFKDSKTYQAWKNRAAVLYDIKIQLTESFIHKGDNLSSRKNVFVLNNTRQGLRVLVQSDDAQQMKEWYQAVMKASDMSVPKETKYVSSNFLSPEVTLRNQHLPEDNKTSHRIERVRSVKSKTKEGSLEDLPSSPEEQQVKIHRRLKNFFMRRPLKESLEQRGILKNEGVFGCLLEDVCLNEEDCIPQFVKKCVDAIESKEENMKAVGLYRASGNLSQVQKIRHQVNQENYKVLEEEDDVHVLTGTLKLFFRELKEPLIPFEFYKTLTNHDSRQTDEEKLSQFLDIVKRLPEANHNTLQFLLRHLLKITEYKEYNQMTLHTLSIVFGPSLMWPEEESQQQQNMAMELLVVQNFVVESLLKMYSKIFAN